MTNVIVCNLGFILVTANVCYDLLMNQTCQYMKINETGIFGGFCFFFVFRFQVFFSYASFFTIFLYQYDV